MSSTIFPYEVPIGGEIAIINMDGELFIYVPETGMPVPWGTSILLKLTAEQDLPDNVVQLFPSDQ